MNPSTNVLGPHVTFPSSSEVAFCHLSHVQIGEGCRLLSCIIEGSPDAPVIIEDGVELLHCHVLSTGKSASFSFGAHRVAARPVRIGQGAKLASARIENSTIGAGVKGQRCQITSSVVGDHSQLRAHSQLTLTHAAAHCNLGSEISKSLLLGEGFVSEHTASYLSLVAPTDIPILAEDGRELLLEGLPNLTNIGAGTVFANYSGKPKPPPRAEATPDCGPDELSRSPGSLKGTAVVYGAFTAVNSVIVNRYGQPSVNEDPFALLRRRDLTILGLASFAERKVTGRIPAFSYAGSTSAKRVKIGWVLEHQPGIVLNIFKKMQKRLKGREGKLFDLLEGSLRLERQLLQEQLDGGESFFDPQQLREGIQIFSQHLDGRWKIDEDGQLTCPWVYNDEKQRWVPALH